MSEHEPKDYTGVAMEIAQSWIDQKNAAVVQGLKRYFGDDSVKIGTELSPSTKNGVYSVLWSALRSKLDQGENVSSLTNYSDQEISKLVYDSYIHNSQI